MSKNLKELEAILCEMEEGSVVDERKARLHELIHGDIEARQFYLEYCQMHAMLMVECGELGAQNDEDFYTRKAALMTKPKSNWPRILAWAATIAFAAVGVVGYLWSPQVARIVKVDPTRGDALGKFSAVSGCEFEFGVDGTPVRVGQDVMTGRYRMKAGIADLTFDGGATVTVEAPADFRVGFNGIWLSNGRAFMDTRGDCTNFSVNAQGLHVTHLGTKYAVDAPAGLPREVHVFEGEVLVKMFNKDGVKVGERNVRGGEAIRVFQDTGDTAGIDLDASKYVRGLQERETQYARDIMKLKPALYFPMRPTRDGRTLVDISGNGCNAEIHGGRESGVLWSPGQIGMAIRFEGPKRRDYALIPQCDVIRSKTFTVMAWVYAESRPAWASIMKHWGQKERGFFHFGLTQKTGRLEGHVNEKGGKEIFVRDRIKLPLHQWHHVAFVVDETSLRLYRNGVMVDSAKHHGIEPDPRLKAIGIGAKPMYPKGAIRSWGLWHGKLDEIAFFNRPLSSATIRDLYEAGLQDGGLAQR